MTYAAKYGTISRNASQAKRTAILFFEARSGLHHKGTKSTKKGGFFGGHAGRIAIPAHVRKAKFTPNHLKKSV